MTPGVPTTPAPCQRKTTASSGERGERTLANKQKAISYAAYRALVDLFPIDQSSVYIPLMQSFGYDPNDNSTDSTTPTGIGNVACAAVLSFRHHDGSNQLGDLAPGPTPTTRDTLH